jgi:hypothetical protein
MNESFHSLSQIITEDSKFKRVRELIWNDEIMSKFFLIFPDLMNHVMPDKVAKSTLYLKVENSVLRSELKFHDVEMIAKINAFFNEERIHKIRFFS